MNKKTVLAASLALALGICGAGTAASAQPMRPPSVQEVAAATVAGASQTLVAGPLTQFNTATAVHPFLKASAALDDGGYLLLWKPLTASSPEGTEFYLQRFDSSGKKVGRESRLALSIQDAVLAVLKDGSVVAAYLGSRNAQGQSMDPPGALARVFIQKFDASGAQTLPQTAVDSTRGVSVKNAFVQAIALDDAGFAVSWSSFDPAGGQAPLVSVQRYDSEAHRSGSPVVVSNFKFDGGYADHTIQAAPDGGFLLKFTSLYITTPARPCHSVVGRGTATSAVYYDKNLVSRQILAPTSCTEVLPLQDGNYMLFQANDSGPYSQLVDGNGALVGPQKPIAARNAPFTARLTTFNARPVLADGSYLLVWRPEFSSPSDLKAQRYTSKGDSAGETLTFAGIDPAGFLPLIDGDLVLAGYLSNRDPAAPIESPLFMYTQRWSDQDGMGSATKHLRQKYCQEQTKGMTGQARKAFMDRCFANKQ